MSYLTTEQLADLEQSAFLLSEEIQSQQITAYDIDPILFDKVNSEEMHKSPNHAKRAGVTPFYHGKARYR